MPVEPDSMGRVRSLRALHRASCSAKVAARHGAKRNGQGDAASRRLRRTLGVAARARLPGGVRCFRRALRRARARHPDRRHGPGFREARGPAAPRPRARAARGDARHRRSRCAARATSISRARTRRCATRRSCGSPTTSSSTRATRRLPDPRDRAARVSLPSDRSFGSCDEALAHLRGPRLAADTDLYWDQQLLDVLLEYPIESDRADFSIHPAARRASASAWSPRCASCRRAAPSARSSSTATPASCASIRAGTRRRCASSASGFCHILDGSTTCCSCCAS